MHAMRLYSDQSDHISSKRRFHYAQATLTASQLRINHAPEASSRSDDDDDDDDEIAYFTVR